MHVLVARRALCLAALAVSLAGCDGYVRRGSTLYADGRYVEAAEVFERTEHRLNVAPPRERAEYGLYRGMTLLVLGDLTKARHWLAYAYDIERANPGSLRADRRALLDRGWFELGQRLRADDVTARNGTAVAAHPAPGAAVAPSEPPAIRPVAPSNERTLVPR